MCLTCLREHIDITAGICKQAELQYCKSCDRYLQPPSEWINARWESRELLALCLKKLKGLKNLELVDACFLWTERHSKRIKVKLVVEGNSNDYSSLKQGVIIDYVIQNRMGHECHRIEAKDYWRCVVQVRQHAENKKTYMYLEQLILKHKAHENTLGIKPAHGGLDFFYSSESHSRKLVNFLESMVPVKVTPSRRLISIDKKSNVHIYKYTWSVEIAPLSKDNLVCLSHKLRQQLGNLPSLCLVYRVTHGIQLIDPMAGQISELSGLNYFRSPFGAICNPKQLIEFVVMDIELLSRKDIKNAVGQCQKSCHKLCDIWLIRASQLGKNKNTTHTRSHLGHVLSVGDTVLGYSMPEANVNEVEFDKLKSNQIPDVILVRKCHDRSTRNKKRLWKLKHLAYGGPIDGSTIRDTLDFMEDLEEDIEIRKNVNLYRDYTNIPETNGKEENESPQTFTDLTNLIDEVSLVSK